MRKQAEEITPEQMLADMGLHARSSVVHVEPTTVAEWRECIGHVLCGAAFDAGLAQATRAESDNLGVDRWPVLRPFVAAMVRKLDRNKPKKGGREGWQTDDPRDLMRRVLEEAAEMHAVVDSRGVPGSEILDEAADVANMAMMVADASGALP